MDSNRFIPIEEQFKVMADTAPVLIWISGTDKLCYFFNQGWLGFTGRTMEQEYDNGWAEGVHPEDFDRCFEIYNSSFDARKPFRMEYRLKRYDGIYRWLLDNGVPRYAADGSFAGYIGSCIDIDELLTTQRVAEHYISAEALKKEKALNQELLRSNDQLSKAKKGLLDLNDQLELIVEKRTSELSQSESRFRYLIQGAPVAISTLKGRELVIESANELMLKVWGKSSDIIGKRLIDALPEIKDQPFHELLDRVYTSGEPFYGNEVLAQLEHEGTRKESYFNFIFKPLQNSSGQTDAIIVIATKVSEQIHARKKLESIGKRMYSMVMTAPIAMTVLRSHELYIEIVNQPMLHRWDKKNEQVTERPLLEVFPELMNTSYPALLQGVFDTGIPVKIAEVRSPHLHREEYIDFSYEPIHNSDGLVEAILVTVNDITEQVMNRKQLEISEQQAQAMNEELTAINEELNSSNDETMAAIENLKLMQVALEEKIELIEANEKQFRFILNAIPQQVWTASPDGALDYVNEMVCNDFGYSNQQIVGHGWKEFIHPDDLPGCLEKWTNSLQTASEYMVEFRLKFADGSYHWHLGRALPLMEANLPTLWLGTNTNIETQKKNEQQKDEFISIASHELKTPLTSIKAYTQLMARANRDPKLDDLLKKSSGQVANLNKLITELLDVTKINAGKMTYDMSTFDFGQMVEESVEGMQHISLSHELIIVDCQR